MSGPSMPKDKPIRLQKLRDAARDAPECFSCHKPNDGTVVGCHPPNKLRRGGGMGYKGDDMLSFCCDSCHSIIDGRIGNFNREEREAKFLDAFFWSTCWLVRSGRLG